MFAHKLFEGGLCSLLVLTATPLFADTNNGADRSVPRNSQGQAVMGPSKDMSLSKLTPPDAAFVKEAATGGMAEVKLSKLAMSKGTSPEVKTFAQQMITDHTKANDQLKMIADRKGVMLPNDVMPAHKMAYERLAKMSGNQFDRAYLDQMIKDHDTTLAVFQQEATAGHDSDLKNFAAQTLPTLKTHDNMAHHDDSVVDHRTP